MAGKPSEELSEELARAAESVYDGWYAERRVDWEDLIDRVEAQTGIDLGASMLAPTVKAIQRHIRAYRKAG